MLWSFGMAFPALIFWGFGIPIAATFILKHHYNELHELKTKALYGFLYEGYRIECFFWYYY